jgi:hypothetical protein
VTNFATFKRNVIKTQKSLYNFVKRGNLKEREEVFFVQENEDCPSENNFELMLLPEIKVEDPIEKDVVFDLAKCTEELKEEIDSEIDETVEKFDWELKAPDTTVVENFESNRAKRIAAGKSGTFPCPHCDVKFVVKSMIKRHVERVSRIKFINRTKNLSSYLSGSSENQEIQLR